MFISVNTKTADSNGTILLNFDSESELMGDTWNQPGRIQVGSASNRGGIVSGDKYPSNTPWKRQGSLNVGRYPPYKIWEGDLRPGKDIVLLTPTIWEWDPGAGFWDGWLEWQVQVDAKYGQRAKDIFGGIWPVSKPVFDAVSLGIQTIGTLAGLWSPLGQAMRRPIGTRRDPNNPDGSLFNPITIALNSESAKYLASHDLQGFGEGIVELLYSDDPYLRGVYSLYVQIDELSPGISEWTEIGHANDVVAMTALDGHLFCVTTDNSLWVRPPILNDTDWKRVGNANGVRAMAAAPGSLYFAATNGLHRRDPVLTDVAWQRIGTVPPDIRGLAVVNGEILAATGDNRLLVRS